MHRPNILLIILLILTSCSDADLSEQKDTEPSPKAKAAEKEVNVSNPKDDMNNALCACLDTKSVNDCYYAFVEVEKVNPDDVFDNTCYREKKYKPLARNLCDCVNVLKQASLDCDDMERTYDKLYSPEEKEVIADFFGSMECLQ